MLAFWLGLQYLVSLLNTLLYCNYLVYTGLHIGFSELSYGGNFPQHKTTIAEIEIGSDS